MQDRNNNVLVFAIRLEDIAWKMQTKAVCMVLRWKILTRGRYYGRCFNITDLERSCD